MIHKTIIFFLAAFLYLTKSNATVRHVAMVAGDNDLTGEIQNAVAAASSTVVDTIQFGTGGLWPVLGYIYIGKIVHILGPKIPIPQIPLTLYRPESLSESALNSAGLMFGIYINSTRQANLIIKDINFVGKKPSITANDGLSEVSDGMITIEKCNGFVIYNCSFQNGGNHGLRINHHNKIANGLISNCKFINNAKKYNGSGAGYGIVIYGEGGTTASDWIDQDFGSPNNIFIEDCYFEGNRHAIASNNGGLYVARYNVVKNNVIAAAFDVHEAHDGTTPVIGSRMSEWYRNYISNDYLRIRSVANAAARNALVPYSNGDIYIVQEDDQTTWVSNGLTAGAWTQCTIGNGLLPIPSRAGAPIKSGLDYYALTNECFGVRGGEVVIWGNKVNATYMYPIHVEDYYVGNDDTYPYSYGVGYASQLQYNNSHTGAGIMHGDGDLYEWDNQIDLYPTEYVNKFYIHPPKYLVNRDVQINTKKPGYAPYQYPHPMVKFVK